MKTNILSILAAGAVMLGAVSCDDKWTPPTTEEGSVDLTSLSVNMSDAEKVSSAVVSRATVDLSDYIVTVTDRTGAQPAKTYTYGAMPEVLTLPVGDYTLSVKSHEVQKAEWERPLYEGTKDFSITQGKISQIGVVTCAFASLKVTVDFSDDLLAVLGDDVKVTIIANDEGLIDFTPGETRAAYFAVLEGSNTMVAHFEGTVDGTYTSEDPPCTNVEAGVYQKVSYRSKQGPDIPEQTGGVNPGGITLDTEVIAVDIDGNVQVGEDVLDPSDRPGQEESKEPVDPIDPVDPVDPEEPKATECKVSEASTNLKLDEVNTAREGFGDAIVTIKSENGIKNLIVTIDTDQLGFEAALADLFLDKPFDLAYPGEAEANLVALNLPVGHQVIDQTSVDFNITDFVPMLLAFPGNHNFILSVTDNQGICETMTLRFIAKE